jgi:hypothetical protein
MIVVYCSRDLYVKKEVWAPPVARCMQYEGEEEENQVSALVLRHSAAFRLLLPLGERVVQCKVVVVFHDGLQFGYFFRKLLEYLDHIAPRFGRRLSEQEFVFPRKRLHFARVDLPPLLKVAFVACQGHDGSAVGQALVQSEEVTINVNASDLSILTRTHTHTQAGRPTSISSTHRCARCSDELSVISYTITAATAFW